MGLSKDFIIQSVRKNNFRLTGHATIQRIEVNKMEEKDLCDLCEGELEHKKVDLEIHIRKELVICEGLPADICKQCGEKYFSADGLT